MTTPPSSNNDMYPNLSVDVLCELSTKPPYLFVTSSKIDLPKIEQACVDMAKQGEGLCTISIANVGLKQKEYCNYISNILSNRGLESGVLDMSSYNDTLSDPNYHKLVVIWKK